MHSWTSRVPSLFPLAARGGVLGIVSSIFDCAPSAGTGMHSAIKGNIFTGLRNVVWPPDVANSSSGRTSRPGELFPNPQSSGTDWTGAAAVSK